MSSWVYILPDDGDPGIVVFDTTLSETHDCTAEVTEHPVEDQSNVADHVLIQPFTFTCEVFVTNQPITDIGRGSIETVEMEVPRYSPPALSSVTAAVGAIVDALLGPPPPLKLQTLLFPEPFNRVKEVYDTLFTLHTRKALLSVVTSVRTYEKMVLVGLSLPRDEPDGASFQLSFKQITIVETLTVTAPKPLEPRGAKGAKKGAQAAKPVGGKDAVKGTSLALKALKSLGITE